MENLAAADGTAVAAESIVGTADAAVEHIAVARAEGDDGNVRVAVGRAAVVVKRVGAVVVGRSSRGHHYGSSQMGNSALECS